MTATYHATFLCRLFQMTQILSSVQLWSVHLVSPNHHLNPVDQGFSFYICINNKKEESKCIKVSENSSFVKDLVSAFHVIKVLKELSFSDIAFDFSSPPHKKPQCTGILNDYPAWNICHGFLAVLNPVNTKKLLRKTKSYLFFQLLLSHNAKLWVKKM